MTKAKRLPAVEILREHFTYDPRTGSLYWKKPTQGGIKPGTIAGCQSNKGRDFRVRFKDLEYRVHRIAYAIYHGHDPWPLQIDHINRDPSDNRIENLRTVTPSENCLNRRTWMGGPHQPAKPRSRPVLITFPDGRGTVWCDSGATAARILNRRPNNITRACNRSDNMLYWGVNTPSHREPSGIRVCYEL